jgi:hypothetical protein
LESQNTGADAVGTVQTLRSDRETRERLLWSDFREAESPEQRHPIWLAIQCSQITGVQAGLLVVRNRRSGSFALAARWPAEKRSPAHLRAAAEKVAQDGRSVALQLGRKDAGDDAHTVLAQPIEVADQVEAVVVLEVDARPEAELEAALRQLGWGAAWVELDVGGGVGDTSQSLVSLLELVAAPLEHERFQASATAFVTELATRFECERVSLGHHERGKSKLRALSHSAQFDHRADLTRRIEAAMDETIDHKGEILWPLPAGAPHAQTRAHAELARESDGGTICSMPIARGDDLCGVVTLERSGERPFTESELELIEPAVEMAGAILEIHRRDDRSIALKALDAARETTADFVGPRHVGLKLAIVSTLLLTLFLALANGDFRVTADTTLEARFLRAAVAPFDGYIMEAPKRAGDRVMEGDSLALLDDRDLTLEHAGYVGRLEQQEKQLRQALAERNSPDVRILTAKVDQVRAQRDLAADKLSRTRIFAHFDGIVVTGDLSQNLGSPVKRGDLLFEVAPLDEYRPVLEVDERDIDEVRVGQAGQLLLSAFPESPLTIRVEKITPVSTPKEGRNYFRVEAHIEDAPDLLRPGMEGVAKVEVDRRRMLWIWTHEIFDWLRLAFWNWMP